jgi:hypothetical protein
MADPLCVEIWTPQRRRRGRRRTFVDISFIGINPPLLIVSCYLLGRNSG